MTKLLQQMYKRKLELEDQINDRELEWENLRREMDGCTCRKDIREINGLMLQCDNDREELQEELVELEEEIKYEES